MALRGSLVLAAGLLGMQRVLGVPGVRGPLLPLGVREVYLLLLLEVLLVRGLLLVVLLVVRDLILVLMPILLILILLILAVLSLMLPLMPALMLILLVLMQSIGLQFGLATIAPAKAALTAVLGRLLTGTASRVRVGAVRSRKLGNWKGTQAHQANRRHAFTSARLNEQGLNGHLPIRSCGSFA